MNDFLFFEITYKLSEILKIVSTKSQGGVLAYLALISALSGVTVGFLLNFFKEKYTEWNKSKKYLNCIKWEVEYNKKVAEESFRFSLDALDKILKGENGFMLVISRHYQTTCFDKYYHEVLINIDEKRRETLCHMQSIIINIQETNEWLSSKFVHQNPAEVQHKLNLLLRRSGRLLACAEVYLGLKESFENMTPADTAKELGIRSIHIRRQKILDEHENAKNQKL